MTEQEREYVRKVVQLVLSHKREQESERPEFDRVTLPMIPLSFSKHNAIPEHLLEVLFPPQESPCDSGDLNDQKPKEASIFFRAYEDRGPHNRGKKIYLTGVTPDLYHEKYQKKVQVFLEELLSPKYEKEQSGLPKIYQDLYFELYWSLHLGVTSRQMETHLPIRMGEEFNLLLGLLGADNENDVARLERAAEFVTIHKPELDEWIDRQLNHAEDDSFVYYWMRNKMDPDDVTFEVFHNFLAFSQWGNTLHQTMERLRSDLPDGSKHLKVRETFRKIMNRGDYDTPDDEAGRRPTKKDGDCPTHSASCPFTPLDRFVMELFRTIAPNDGSLSARPKAHQCEGQREDQLIAVHRHQEISHDPLHWANPDDFDPDRYLGKPVSTDIDEEVSRELGFPRCPFAEHKLISEDGRAVIKNDTFGTEYSVHNGRPDPVLEYAGYAPFGFGYRRCPGELLTVEVVKDFLRKIYNEGITFHKIRLPEGTATMPMERIPLGVGNMVRNDIAFKRTEGAWD